MHKSKSSLFKGFRHCGGQKVWMIEGQGINAPAFTAYKSAMVYRKRHGLDNHIIWCVRYSTVLAVREDFSIDHDSSDED